MSFPQSLAPLCSHTPPASHPRPLCYRTHTRTHAHTHTRTPAHTHARTSPRCHVASIYTFHQVRNFHVCPSAQTQASTHFQKVTPCCSFSLVWCLFPPSQNYQRMSYTSFSRLRMSQRTRSASSRRSPRSTRSMR